MILRRVWSYQVFPLVLLKLQSRTSQSFVSPEMQQLNCQIANVVAFHAIFGRLNQIYAQLKTLYFVMWLHYTQKTWCIQRWVGGKRRSNWLWFRTGNVWEKTDNMRCKFRARHISWNKLAMNYYSYNFPQMVRTCIIEPMKNLAQTKHEYYRTKTWILA